MTRTAQATDDVPQPDRKVKVTRQRKRSTARADNKIYELRDGQLVNLYSVEIDRTAAERVWQGACAGDGTLNVFYKDQKGGSEWYFLFCIKSLKVSGTVRCTSHGDVLNVINYFRGLGFTVPDKMS